MSPKPQSEPHLKAGSRVEISPEDDGFRGSFFTGTVIRRASKNDSTMFLVEYDKLFADETGTNRLREVLSYLQLRPTPPREADREFKLSEEVDAYHSDGWWEGVITEDHGNGRFAVFFRTTREQLEFDQGDLRLHREWMHGKWVPPLEGQEEEGLVTTEVESVKVTPGKGKSKKATPEKGKSKRAMPEKFQEGTLVEVTSDEEGFQGAWFTATVVKPSKRNKFLIEYHTLRNEDDTDFLREKIDDLHIRPHPPEISVVDQFKLLDEVDASYNDGWWVGVISKVLDGSRYIVYFKNTNEEIEFKHSDLRPHQEWIDGKWIETSKVIEL